MAEFDITQELVRVLRVYKAKGQERICMRPETLKELGNMRNEVKNKASSKAAQESPSAKQYTTSSSQGERTPSKSDTTSSPVTPEDSGSSHISDPEVARMDWQTVQESVAACTKCPLHKNRTNVVFGSGDPQARLMIIGEAPGQEEDKQGLPFVGRAGQQLDKMIRAMQFERSEVFIGNIVKCRPPANRAPETEEANSCIPYLQRQIELIQPDILLLLGGTPLKRLIGKTAITREHGKWYTVQGVPAIPSFHPVYLLRSPSKKREAWEDLQKVMRYLGKDPEKTMGKQ